MSGSGAAVVVGASLAGAKTSIALRRNGWDGPILLVGDDACLPYERPLLSKGYLAGTRDLNHLLVAPAQAYAEHEVDLVLGHRVVEVQLDRRVVVLDDGRDVPFGVLVLATGARARRPDLPGAGLRGVHVLRTLADADRLRAQVVPGSRVVVMGMGLIGAEVAATLSGLGALVVGVDPFSTPLNRAVAPVVGSMLAALHRDNGVRLVLGEPVTRLLGDEWVQGVQLGSGEQVVADVVVAGLGAIPNTELAAAAGLDVGRGIRTDELGRTSSPDVYAAGDVVEQFVPHRGRHERVEHWKQAIVQAEAVAATICGTPTAVDVAPWFWTEQHGVHLEAAGWPGEDGLVVVDGLLDPDATTGGFLATTVVGEQVRAVAGVGRGRELRALSRRLPAGIHYQRTTT